MENFAIINRLLLRFKKDIQKPFMNTELILKLLNINRYEAESYVNK